MPNNRKIIISDYDGTFFKSKDGIKANVKKVDEFRKKDNLFIIATGNNYVDFQKVISEYSIKYDYLILDQGACIFDNKNNLLKVCFLEHIICKNIISEILKIQKEYKKYTPYGKTSGEENITKISVNFTDLQEAIDFTEKINTKFKNNVNAYTMIFKEINIVEIVSSTSNKNEAIKYIVRKEKAKQENIYTVGDGYNDIIMIQNFNGYCMTNSVDKLLKECPKHIETVADLIDKVMQDK